MKNYLRKCLRGEEKLWKVFWLIYILGGSIASIVVSLTTFQFIIGAIAEITINDPGLWTFFKQFPFLLLGIALILFGVWYTFFALISLWKYSWNTKNKIWGYMARVFIFISITYTIFEGVFEK